MTHIGESFLDRGGQRWSVTALRPGSTDQFVVEAQMKGSYPRVALYVMTAHEFKARARAADPRSPSESERRDRPQSR